MLTGGGGEALAQGAAPTTTTPSNDPATSETTIAHSATGTSPAPDNAIREVVVTAQHRSENLQRAALSVTAVPGAALDRQGKVNLADALVDVPSVQVQGTPQGGQVYIRGIGANGDSNYVDPTAAIYRDGIYTARAEAVFGALYDVDRIEVLRGPQGTLYGRNATAGAVNILTGSPSQHYEADANLDFGNYNLRHFDGAVNLPVTDSFALRVALMKEDRDGYFSNDGDASHELGYRIKAHWNITSRLTVDGLIDYLHQTGHGVTSTATPGGFGPFNWDQRHDDPWYVDALHPADTDNYRFVTYGLNINYDFGWGVATIIPAYSQNARYANSGLVAGTFGGSSLTSTVWQEQETSVEARIASPASSAIKWVAGLYYLHDPQGETGIGSGGPTYFSETNPDIGTDSIAGFAQATYPITDRLRLTGGLRYTSDKRTDAYNYTSTAVAGYTTSGSATDRYGALTYKAGAEYDLSPHNLLYADISSAYKSGGFSLTTPPVTYQPEHLTAYELGSKNRFLDGVLQLNAEAFYYDYRNYQVEYATCQTTPIPDAYIPTGYVDATCGSHSGIFAQYIANAGASHIAGADEELQWRFTRTDEIDVSATFLYAHYGDLVLPGAGAATPPGGGTGGDFDLTGTTIIQSPKWSGLVGYQHTFTLGGFGSLQARLQSKLSTGYYVNTKKDMPGAYQGGYTRSDGFLTYTTPDGERSISLWARNLENNAQTTNVLPLYRRLITDPRTYGVNISAKFK